MNHNAAARAAFTIDALLPPEMADKAELVGVDKAMMGPRNTFALAAPSASTP